VPFLLVLVVLAVRWARARESLSTTHVVYVVAVAVFGLLAYRNVAPAVILLVPELARPPRPVSDPDQEADGDAEVGPRVPVWLGAAVAAGVLLAGVRLATTDAVGGGEPERLVATLAAEGRPVRLLNHYDVGGYVTGTASPPLHVAIDGRTDLWPSSFVRGYVDALNGNADWRPLVDALRPDAAILPRDAEVTRGLVIERHWHVKEVEGTWALLEPPS
jgi:hypothetical protein